MIVGSPPGEYEDEASSLPSGENRIRRISPGWRVYSHTLRLLCTSQRVNVERVAEANNKWVGEKPSGPSWALGFTGKVATNPGVLLDTSQRANEPPRPLHAT